ncbi:hypothetical protein RLDS_18860 [Sphingobium lactosutens DS20]|uniref:Uncharacterized protein n=1 Tax=Sphingobium lactosutens DS20 TaxID=1331060 RepID=T0HIL7_9SPHN|nr:hypothetical protein RLDS_18860 [Sphingobium lactosutens DS20]
MRKGKSAKLDQAVPCQSCGTQDEIAIGHARIAELEAKGIERFVRDLDVARLEEGGLARRLETAGRLVIVTEGLLPRFVRKADGQAAGGPTLPVSMSA